MPQQRQIGISITTRTTNNKVKIKWGSHTSYVWILLLHYLNHTIFVMFLRNGTLRVRLALDNFFFKIATSDKNEVDISLQTCICIINIVCLKANCFTS